MAKFVSILKSKAWVTADEVGEWIFDDKTERFALPAEGAFASLDNQFLRYTSRNIGISGNDIAIEYTGGVTAGSELIIVGVNSITVQIEDGVSTVEQIRSAIATNGAASALVSVEAIVEEPDLLVDVQARSVNIIPSTNLTGGLDDEDFAKKDVPIRRKRYEKLINAACDKIESIIQTSVLAREYQEDIDGNDSNVVVPSQWPIISLDQLRIDFNRNFDPSTIVEDINQILRGMPDSRQTPSELRLIGNDIYLRDDDNDNVIGRVFAGSVAGSIRINYTAGWAKDADDVPGDLHLATLQLVEWYEFRRSNKDIGTASKGVRGESYSKMGDLMCGIPKEIYELIEPYINTSFGVFERTQNNIFGV